MVRKPSRLIGAIAAGLVLVAAFATPAFAWGGCAINRVCTYWDSEGNGAMYYYTGPTNNTCIEIGEPWDNDISSAWNTFNTGTYRARFYPYHGCSGVAIVVDPNSRKTFPSWWNDTASSMKIGP